MFIEDPRFPDCYAFGAEGGPGFWTDVVAVQSGYEFRNQVRAKSLGTWTITKVPERPEDHKLALDFWFAAGGRANAFRFKDWQDFEATDVAGKFLQLTGTTYQMVKEYYLHAAVTPYLRLIQKPVDDSVTVTGGTTPTVDYTTGIVTSATSPTSWRGQFDVPARFDMDDMSRSIITRSRGELLIDWPSIRIREVRL